ncbi:MAG TPA: 4-hydroxy-tetrahydrodipicolinate synthase [Thermoleophilaceae bacterium]|nr:4-hydroxy-tetrahydrodipicolinate synthase [Thermoleophilaceae bacterium]
MADWGVITAALTPFTDDGSVDEDAFVALVGHLLDNGSDGVVVAGTTGEGATLTDAEKISLFELAVGEFGDGATIVAGTGSNDTAHTVHLTERATAAGCDAMLCVTPYYNKPNFRGLQAHYEAVAAATDRPIVLYNIPSRCVVDISNEELARLAEIPNVSAVKQARYEDLEPIDGLDLLAGNDDTFADVLDKGGAGGILVASHLVGPEMRRMVDEPDLRREIHTNLGPVFKALAVTTNPIPVKTAMAMLGHRVGGFRLPMIEASADEREALRTALERQGLLSAV